MEEWRILEEFRTQQAKPPAEQQYNTQQHIIIRSAFGITNHVVCLCLWAGFSYETLIILIIYILYYILVQQL